MSPSIAPVQGGERGVRERAIRLHPTHRMVAVEGIVGWDDRSGVDTRERVEVMSPYSSAPGPRFRTVPRCRRWAPHRPGRWCG